MNWFPPIWKRLVQAFTIVIVCIAMPVDSFSQSNTCRQLSNTLQSLARHTDFRNLARNADTARTLASDISRIERAFVQEGCQRAFNAGQNLNRQCRNAARQITRGRDNLVRLQRSVDIGQAVATQRQQIENQLIIQGCLSGGSSANLQTRQQPRNFFEQLFDALSGNALDTRIAPDEGFGFQNYNTVRSVCVRQSDGYYWPVSFATVFDYLPNDALLCQSQCPGAAVELYYYNNPGQEPADMVNLNGQPYTALPNAFLYRNEFSRERSCRTQAIVGTIEIEQVRGRSRTMLLLDDRRLPLPLRDPRREVETIIAEIIRVTLPRPRPHTGGTDAIFIPVESAELRIVEVGGRLVRLVGPETPYAPSAAEES